MSIIITDLSNEGLKDLPHYKLNVQYPLFLKLYHQDAFQELLNFTDTGNEQGSHLLKITTSRNMTTHLATTNDDQYRLRQEFNFLLEERELRKYNLVNVADTLFFTCLHFETVHFSDLRYRTIEPEESYSDDDPALRNDSIKNVKELSTLFLAFNKARDKNNIGEIAIEVGGTQIIIDQPALGRWIIEAIEDKISKYEYPIGILGEHMFLLSQTMQSKYQQVGTSQTSLLENLKALSLLSEHKYGGELNRMIARYCLDVHKMLTFLMNEDPEHFSNVQLRLYAAILKLLRVRDFTKRRPTKSALANRLRSVIVASA